MKDAIKAVICKGEELFFTTGKLTLDFSGEHHEALKNFFRARGLVPGSPVVVKFQDKESKSYRQLKTFFLALRIYRDYLLREHGIDRAVDDDLEDEFKRKYGVSKIKTAEDGIVERTFKGLSRYTMREMSALLGETLDEILIKFNDSGYYDKRFDEMMQEFNSQPVEPDKEIELY